MSSFIEKKIWISLLLLGHASHEGSEDDRWKKVELGTSTSTAGLLLSIVWNSWHQQKRATRIASTWSFSIQWFAGGDENLHEEEVIGDLHVPKQLSVVRSCCNVTWCAKWVTMFKTISSIFQRLTLFQIIRFAYVCHRRLTEKFLPLLTLATSMTVVSLQMICASLSLKWTRWKRFALKWSLSGSQKRHDVLITAWTTMLRIVTAELLVTSKRFNLRLRNLSKLNLHQIVTFKTDS